MTKITNLDSQIKNSERKTELIFESSTITSKLNTEQNQTRTLKFKYQLSTKKKRATAVELAN